MSIKLQVVSQGSGTCALTGKSESDGLTVAFEGETPCFLSKKAFWQILSMKTAQTQKVEPRTETRPVAAPVTRLEAKPAAPMATPVAPANGPVATPK